MALVGSDPIERKQVSGTRLFDSSNIPSMSRMTPSAYFVPMDSAMYFFAWAAVLSGTHDLHKDGCRVIITQSGVCTYIRTYAGEQVILCVSVSLVCKLMR